ncbi:MAG TPA: PAC2 family protein [Acidimicrobiales bacterium]|nr:PAC2 family protein [Acidimicrobiales bacterium]
MTLYEQVAPLPDDFDDPVLVGQLDGWIDAGGGGATAIAHLLATVPTELLVRFDRDAFVDYRARRPTMRITDGVNVDLTWPEIELHAGRDRTGKPVLVLHGPEPDFRWHAFTDAVLDLSRDFGVSLFAGLGAFPAPVPHTRPVRMAATASTRRLADLVGFVSGTIEVPTGVCAALEVCFHQAGIEAVGLWARVPHYVSAMPYPAAAAALLETLVVVTGVEVDVRELRAAAALTGARIDELIANSEEHVALVRQLETTIDEAEAIDAADLPSGEELAAELERFLRGEL